MTMSSRKPRKVYFIKPIGMAGPVKIGCSISPTRRRESLATWAPFPLEVVAEMDGDFELERQLHALFRDDHRGHEWFDWTPELQALIDSVTSGTFDVRTLPAPQFLPRRKRGNGWGEHQRRMQSYCARIRHTERRSGRLLPSESYGWRCFVDDPAKMAPVDAFLADPQRHGVTPEQRKCEKIADLRRVGTPFANLLIAQLTDEPSGADLVTLAQAT